jgi:hypothetical protein
MKTRIALGASLLLMIGSAVAGTLMFGQSRVEPASVSTVAPVAQQEVTPQMIAMWKATATPSDYIAPRAPI